MMSTFSTLMRLFLLYTFLKYLFSSSTSSSTPTIRTTPDGRTVTVPSSALRPAWPDLTRFDLHVYINNDAHFSLDALFTQPPSTTLPYLSTHLLFHESDIRYETETWESPAIRSLNLTLTEPFLSQALRNDSLYAHIYFSTVGSPHSPTLRCDDVPQLQGLISPCHQPYSPLHAMHSTQQLNLHKPPPKVDKRKNLLTGDRADGSNATSDALAPVIPDGAEVQWVSYWKPTLHIRLVHDQTVYPSLAMLPPEVKDAFSVDPVTSTYHPIIYCDYWWLLSTSHMAVNDSLTSLPLLVTYSPIAFFKYRMELSMDASWKMQEQLGTHSEAETESLKRILLDSNPYLLALTMVVSMFHMLFDFLAFKNDVTFWRNTKNTAGLSGRTVLLNSGCQLVVFLYLLDNETSWMILMSTGVGVLIECWKIPKLFRVSVTPSWPFLHFDPKEVATDAEGKGVTEQDQLMLLTHKYDKEAMRYMAYLLYPLVLCYAIYSLMYQTHKSWYSFILTTLVGSVYTFGFINVSQYTHLPPNPLTLPPVVTLSLSHSSLWCAVLWVADGASAVPELQAEERGGHAVAPDELQVPQHHHR